MKARTYLAAFLLVLTFGRVSGLAAPGDLLRTFVTPFPDQGHRFGEGIAVVGDNVLIADRAAYLFDGTTGELLHTFRSPATPNTWGFPSGVGAAGDDVLVGATGDYDSGAAYLFDGTTGQLLQEFRNPTPSASREAFGTAVSALGNRVVVGDLRDGYNQSADHWGAAYLFDSTTGGLLHTFQDPTPGVKNLGYSVAAFGNDVLVGAPSVMGGEDPVHELVHLFDGETGRIVRTFRSPTPSSISKFGVRIAVVGDAVLIGAPGDDTAGADAGAAYLFDVTSGELLQSFLNPTPAYRDGFGAVAAVGNNVLIGAPLDDAAAEDAGAAYLFDATTGELLHTFLDPAPHSRNLFGRWVAALGNNVVVAAPGDGKRDGYTGAVYLFEGPVVIPEPSTLVLLATAAVALLAFARQRRRI